MKFPQVHIAPEAESVIAALPPDLRGKVKNALREISRGDGSGASLGPIQARRIYKAGRFRVLYRRNNGTVWIDAVTLEYSSSLTEQPKGERS